MLLGGAERDPYPAATGSGRRGGAAGHAVRRPAEARRVYGRVRGARPSRVGAVHDARRCAARALRASARNPLGADRRALRRRRSHQLPEVRARDDLVLPATREGAGVPRDDAHRVRDPRPPGRRRQSGVRGGIGAGDYRDLSAGRRADLAAGRPCRRADHGDRIRHDHVGGRRVARRHVHRNGDVVGLDVRPLSRPAVVRQRCVGRHHHGPAATALLILTAVVSPYLISCAIATGDPFYAINYHTVYYRFAEGMPIGAAMTAGDYLRLKFAGHPIGTLDTAFTGEFIRPFITKWRGIDPWSPYVAELLRWLSLTGLLALPFSSKGRLLTVILLGSLIPYAFTWNVGAGGEWRFTMHA